MCLMPVVTAHRHNQYDNGSTNPGPTMDKDTVVTLLKYKRWIDLATLQAIRAIDGTGHGEKRHLTIRLMNHIHVVDMIFRANLRGRPHGYTALNTPETPTVDELETAMTACTDEYIQYVSAMTPPISTNVSPSNLSTAATAI